MNSDDLADATHAARTGPAKATEALLRDARSAPRCVEKLTDAALVAADAVSIRRAAVRLPSSAQVAA